MEEQEFRICLFKETLKAGFDVLKQIGEFIPTDDGRWIEKAEDNLWEDLKNFTKE
jgi:hypothetical protein